MLLPSICCLAPSQGAPLIHKHVSRIVPAILSLLKPPSHRASSRRATAHQLACPSLAAGHAWDAGIDSLSCCGGLKPLIPHNLPPSQEPSAFRHPAARVKSIIHLSKAGLPPPHHERDRSGFIIASLDHVCLPSTC